MGIRCADHVTPLYPQKLALTSPTGGGRSVGIVRSRTKATEQKYPYWVDNLSLFFFRQSASFCVPLVEAGERLSLCASYLTSDAQSRTEHEVKELHVLQDSTFKHKTAIFFFFTFVPCILILSKLFIHQRMHK